MAIQVVTVIGYLPNTNEANAFGRALAQAFDEQDWPKCQGIIATLSGDIGQMGSNSLYYYNRLMDPWSMSSEYHDILTDAYGYNYHEISAQNTIYYSHAPISVEQAPVGLEGSGLYSRISQCLNDLSRSTGQIGAGRGLVLHEIIGSSIANSDRRRFVLPPPSK